jgi:uncharacterized protein DUF4350
MRLSNSAVWFLTLLLLAIFVWGLDQIALAPVETGEVYPPYSSLRADPLGAMALYESLAEQPGIAVDRLYKTRETLDRGTAMFVLGVDPLGWSTVDDRTLEEYEKLTHEGGRLVIAFLPVRSSMESAAKRPVEARWAIRFASREPAQSPKADAANGILPRHSALYFDPGPGWKTVAERDGQITAVERAFGAGIIILVADSYALSNEGLREERDAELVSRLVGPAHRIVFDENHFGVVETGSVTKLMRKYRLQGPVAMLALAAALFLWRSASSFLPAREAPATSAVRGRDSIEGLSSLLRRGIPERDLLDACFGEWSKSVPHGVSAAKVEAEIAHLGKDHPVEAYRAACRAITEKGRALTEKT